MHLVYGFIDKIQEGTAALLFSAVEAALQLYILLLWPLLLICGLIFLFDRKSGVRLFARAHLAAFKAAQPLFKAIARLGRSLLRRVCRMGKRGIVRFGRWSRPRLARFARWSGRSSARAARGGFRWALYVRRLRRALRVR